MTAPQVIAAVTPVFLALVGLEYFVGRVRGRNTLRLNDALASLSLGTFSEVTGLFTKVIGFALYVYVYRHAAVLQLDPSSPWVWLAGLLLYDLAYYVFHRASHRVGLLWAAHVVHHQSEDYNLTTALRQPATSWVVGWLFFLPIAVIGVPPVVHGTVALVHLLYQFWVHTQQVGRLGWFDRWFCSPSNHRVHHAVNDRYIDRNYGGLLMVWDRLFGTFQDERDDDPCVYGTRAPLRSFHPVWANLEVYASLARDAWHAGAWADKLRVWFAPPEWRPADVAARFPRPAFDIRHARRFDPPMRDREKSVAIAMFGVTLAGSLALLTFAHVLPGPALASGVAAVVILLEGIAAVCSRHARQELRASTA